MTRGFLSIADAFVLILAVLVCCSGETRRRRSCFLPINHQLGDFPRVFVGRLGNQP